MHESSRARQGNGPQGWRTVGNRLQLFNRSFIRGGAVAIFLAVWHSAAICEAPKSPESLGGVTQSAAQTVYMEDLFRPDTVTLHLPPSIPLAQVDCLHRRRNGGFVLSVRTGPMCGVYVFRPSGAFLRKVGRKGGGPGEYFEPFCAIEGPRGELIIYDSKLMRVTVFDSTGNFLRSFQTELPGISISVGMLLGPAGRIVLHEQLGYPATPCTIWEYSLAGELMKCFGRLSRESQVVRDRWIGQMEGPNVAYVGGYYFENDFASYLIRKYDAGGHLVAEFGVPPRGWRSLARADFSKMPPKTGTVTPSVMRQLRRFQTEEVDRSSFVRGLQALGNDRLIQTIIYGKRNPIGIPLGFMIYDLDGHLLYNTLRFRNPPTSDERWLRYLGLGMPDGLFVVEISQSEQPTIRIIRLVPTLPETGEIPVQ